jgi:hypothetical protein
MGIVFQVFPLVISSAALFLAWLSYRNSKKVGELQIKVAEETYKRLRREDEEREEPKISYEEFPKDGGPSYLEVKNCSKEPICQFAVKYEILDNQGKENIVSHDYKFPLEIFRPGDVLKFYVVVMQGGRRSMRFICEGKKSNGDTYQDIHDHTFIRYK